MTAVAEPVDDLAQTGLWDRNAEQAVLGGMLLSGDVIAEVAEIVDAGAFQDHRHRTLFTTITGLRERGEPADTLTVANTLDPADLHRLGGVPYLHTLIEMVPVAANAPYYARTVADLAVLRQLDEAAVKIRHMVRSRTLAPAELVEKARTLIADLAGTVANTDGPIRWGELMAPALDAAERVQEAADHGETTSGIPTGLPQLDKVIHGLQGGNVYVVAGESGSGKSTLVSDLVRSAAFDHQHPTLVVNLEMSRNELFNRFVCAHATVDHSRLVSGTMTDDDWLKIAKMCGDTADAPLWIDDSSRLTVADIRVRAHRLHREHGLKVVVVDLVGLVTPAQPNLPREQQVAGISRKLKELSKELDIAIILVAQINRGPQQRADKRPTQNDLRESAQIAHDAAAVILVHRPDKHDKNTPRVGECDLLVDKNRFGPEADITVVAQLHYSRFAPMPA